MTDIDIFDYRLAIVGPTRVGKTSLITAILREAQKLLAGTGVSIDAGDDPTQIRINRYKRELAASLMAGEFNPGAIKGTQEPAKYFLDMKVVRGRTKLRLGILDYPGGWLNPETRSSGRAAEWDECQSWMEESAVLIVPIDATIVMESVTGSDLQDAWRTLETELTADVARKWVQSKIQQSEPGLLILAPVKCESYFNDNGGTKDKSEALFEKIVNRFYSELVQVIREELDGAKKSKDPENESTFIDVSIQYHPVDTIGSVEIKRARWVQNEENDDRNFEAEFLVRDGGRLNPRGADGILTSICDHIIGQEKDRSREIIARFWRWATRENKKLLKVLEELRDKPIASNRRKII